MVFGTSKGRKNITKSFNTYNFLGTGTNNRSIYHSVNLLDNKGFTLLFDTNTSLNYLVNTVRGSTKYLETINTPTETTFGANVFDSFINKGIIVDAGLNAAFSPSFGLSFSSHNNLIDIVTYTGTAVARTVSHSLGTEPKLIIVKRLTAASAAYVYHTNSGNTRYYRLDTSDAAVVATGAWNNTNPTSSVFTVGTDANVNGIGDTLIAFLFAEVANLSKFGTFTKSGSPVAVTGLGFTPKAILVMRQDDIAPRYFFNKSTGDLGNQESRGRLDTFDVSNSSAEITFDSDGFTYSSTDGTYVYSAFA